MTYDSLSDAVHDPSDAIIGIKTQQRSSDNRDCDNRKSMPNGSMNVPALRPEAANLFRRLDDLGLSQASLAETLGLAPNKISKARHGERRFTAAEVLKAHEWLDEIERQRKQGVQSDTLPTRDASTGETAAIIALDLSLSMGPGTPIEEFIESRPVEFDIGLLRSITRTAFQHLRIVRGIGDSMEPTFYTGDRILVDTSVRAVSRLDGYYWITLWGAHGLKRVRPMGKDRYLVISDNGEKYDPIEVSGQDLTIEGRAIWYGRDL